MMWVGLGSEKERERDTPAPRAKPGTSSEKRHWCGEIRLFAGILSKVGYEFPDCARTNERGWFAYHAR
jgi:hypothetical protein